MKFPKPMVVKLNIFETPQPDRHLIARCKTEVYAKSEVAAWLKELREILEVEVKAQEDANLPAHLQRTSRGTLAREILEEWLPAEEGGRE